MKKALLFFALSLLILGAFISCGKKSEFFKVGDDVHTTQETVGTITESDFDEMLRISNAKDGNAFGQMIMDGKMFIVPKNSTLNVEEIKIGRIKAQYQEKSLWFNSSHVK
ncbi:hypothetical protein PG592_08675 [Riemerella anatipestifer]|uniref:hypothetical protein n=1 Tax=Riemerella phage RAP44 TaxID=936152 RepID=UPI0001F0DF23|nr:hypothetical protein [Riemerella anatipestifer]YP_007003643.1 hypothetical protein F372_gp44 [Riemerella phage RAP44]UIS73906.1 hypothetical protein [Riemerella phage vB_RanS_PT03]UUJ74571.1 hypothetical protein [Riemerella phage vB_RanS_PT15]UVK80360.1 hypothetical protein [Riemerella phage vB_RanS_PT33]WCS66366.1 hypothetical protein CRP5_000011 [Riemerella phage vB_RanS_CRP5]WGH49474.1 hypothetical protein CRP2_000033 [Riemerella phage vB_RanS_CRP2]WHL30534.1 hypothetical protein Henu1